MKNIFSKKNHDRGNDLRTLRIAQNDARPEPLLLFVAPYFAPACYGGAVQVYMGLLQRLKGYRIVVVCDQHDCTALAREQWDSVSFDTYGFEMRRIKAFELHLNSADSNAERKRNFFVRPLQQLRTLGSFFLRGRREWRSLLQELQPDMIVCGGTYSAGWLMDLISPDVVLVNYLHGEELIMKMSSRLLMPWMRRRQMQSLRKATRNIVVSAYTAQLAASLSGAEPDRIELLPNFVDVSRFKISGMREQFRDELGWRDRLVLLTLARLEPRKGIDQALRALAQLHHSERMPQNWLYVIAGQGRERTSLEDLAFGLGIAGHVHFFGFVAGERVPLLYEAADLFIQPNREIDGDTEGFGIVFLEASACGLPVIGGLAGGTADAIEEGVSGFRVDGDSVGAIAEAVHDLVWNSDLRERLGRQGAARVQENFTVEQAAVRFSQILSGCRSHPLKYDTDVPVLAR